MRATMRAHGAMAISLVLLVFVAGCGLTTTGNGAASPGTVDATTTAQASGTVTAAASSQKGALQCTLTEAVRGIDTISLTVACHVTKAAQGDSSFTVFFTAFNHSGQSRSFPGPCTGTIQNGAGSCSQAYTVLAPFSVASGTVRGSLAPSGHALGPMTLTPTVATGTPSINFGTPKP